LPPH